MPPDCRQDLRHGGNYDQIQGRGPFYIECNGASSQYTYYGCRLQERPPKT